MKGDHSAHAIVLLRLQLVLFNVCLTGAVRSLTLPHVVQQASCEPHGPAAWDTCGSTSWQQSVGTPQDYRKHDVTGCRCVRSVHQQSSRPQPTTPGSAHSVVIVALTRFLSKYLGSPYIWIHYCVSCDCFGVFSHPMSWLGHDLRIVVLARCPTLPYRANAYLESIS